jgi:hypothetical protein
LNARASVATCIHYRTFQTYILQKLTKNTCNNSRTHISEHESLTLQSNEDVEMMYEKTSPCPYKDQCDSYQSLVSIEKEQYNLRRIYHINRNTIESYEYNNEIETVKKNLSGLDRFRKRCYNGYKRCLRYWMLKKREETITSEYVLQNTSPHIISTERA